MSRGSSYQGDNWDYHHSFILAFLYAYIILSFSCMSYFFHLSAFFLSYYLPFSLLIVGVCFCSPEAGNLSLLHGRRELYHRVYIPARRPFVFSGFFFFVFLSFLLFIITVVCAGCVCGCVWRSEASFWKLVLSSGNCSSRCVNLLSHCADPVWNYCYFLTWLY